MTNPSKPVNLEKPFMTMKVVAGLALCSVKTVREEISRQRLRAYRIGHKILIKLEDFENYLREREIQVTETGMVPKSPSHLNAKGDSRGDQGMTILDGPLDQKQGKGHTPSEGGI